MKSMYIIKTWACLAYTPSLDSPDACAVLYEGGNRVSSLPDKPENTLPTLSYVTPSSKHGEN
jgi:hypothetical protein